MKEKINRILHKKIPNRYFVYAVMVVVCVLLGKRLVEDYIAYNNPKIYMTMSTQKNGDDYSFQMLYLNSEINYRVGCAPKYHDRQKEWNKKVMEYEAHLRKDYVNPMHIYTSTEIRDGKTYVTFSGTTTTPEGEEVEINYVIELSFECPLGDGWYNQKR